MKYKFILVAPWLLQQPSPRDLETTKAVKQR